jgi:hypothetical protein
MAQGMLGDAAAEAAAEGMEALRAGKEDITTEVVTTNVGSE